MVTYFQSFQNRYYGSCWICGALFVVDHRDGETTPGSIPEWADWLFNVVLMSIDEFRRSGKILLSAARSIGGPYYKSLEETSTMYATGDWYSEPHTWRFIYSVTRLQSLWSSPMNGSPKPLRAILQV